MHVWVYLCERMCVRYANSAGDANMLAPLVDINTYIYTFETDEDQEQFVQKNDCVQRGTCMCILVYADNQYHSIFSTCSPAYT